MKIQFAFIQKTGVLLPASMKLFDGTELIKELLIDQPWCKEELVV